MIGLSTADGLKIYNLSAGKTLPEWLSEKKKAQLRKDEGILFPFAFSTLCSLLCSNESFLLIAYSYVSFIRV